MLLTIDNQTNPNRRQIVCLGQIPMSLSYVFDDIDEKLGLSMQTSKNLHF